MAYLDEEEVITAYEQATEEADQWRIDYPQYERLMDNGLLDDLDENLPEVNDGSLAASLFKLAKRVIKKKLGGTAKTLDRDDAWLTELANIYWKKKILPNSNMKASPRRKWKDAVRKAAGYGGQPIIVLFVDKGKTSVADFMVPYAQDVKLEAGKDSDQDSDIMFWDVYYSKLQLRNMIEDAAEEMGATLLYDSKGKVTGFSGGKAENKVSKVITDPFPAKGKKVAPTEGGTSDKSEYPDDGHLSTKLKNASASYKSDDDDEDTDAQYNEWDLQELINISKAEPEEQRAGNETPKGEQGKGVKKSGYHFFVAWQRGVDAPFMLLHPSRKKCVQRWTNPDPTGDIPCHYLYCYQDFVNPYGVGIVKLAGGTQNVLDYMRQADVLATQLGLRPPKQIIGDEDEVDEDSLVYAQDANWYVGNAKVERMEMANGVYSQLPARISMYKTSLNQLIPTGDTSIDAGAGDPQYSKTPAGVKFQQQSLSIDDEDFSDNVDECYAATAKCQINLTFANMQGEDLMKLDEDEKDQLTKAGLVFPENSNQLNIIWDNSRAQFDFEIDAEDDKMDDDQAALEGRLKAYDLIQKDDTLDVDLANSLKKIDKGELLSDIFSALTESDKIIIDIDQEEADKIIQSAQDKAQQEAQAQSAGSATTPPPKTLGESVAWKPGDLREGERAQALAQVQIKADPASPEAASPNEQQQNHDQSLDVLKVAQTPPPVAPGQQPGAAQTPGQPSADAAPGTPDATALDPATAQKHIEQVMELYKVDAPTATAMLEAERQGYEPDEILAALDRHQGRPTVKEAAHAK